MTRRQLYQFVTETLARAGPGALLDGCTGAMRILRNLPARRDGLSMELLDDAAFSRLLQQDDALGQIYQAINAPALEAAYRAARRQRRKFCDADIPAVTQLFTPRWVVEFLLQNTLGLAWLEMHPESRIELPWLLGRPARRHALRRAREITLLDPACGTMNFGLVAIELLEAMYREELDRAGQPGWPAEPSVPTPQQIGASILRHNLFGIDIDPVALRLARASIELKLRIAEPATHPNLRCADALLDRIDDRFDLIITNPPYLSARNLPPTHVQQLKRAYPLSWRDACACFIDRGVDLLREGGRAGVLAMQSFMFTGAFEGLRQRLSRATAIEAIAHFGGGLFEVGNPGTLQTAAVVLRRDANPAARSRQRVVAFRLTDAANKRAALNARRGRHELDQRELNSSPRSAWSYWLAPALRSTFRACPTLADVAPPRQGLATTDNARFVRFWWEVAPASGRWFPYAKGGRFRRWYEAPRHRVDWADDGAAIKRSIVQRYPYLNGKWAWVAKNASFYGRGGVTYSYLTSGRFSARRLEEGAIFDVAGSALFPEDPLSLLGVLNSSTAAALLASINPTVNFQVGDLARLPVPPDGDDELRVLVGRAIDLQRTLDTFDETCGDFVAPMPWLAAQDLWDEAQRELATIEASVDARVAQLYGLPATPPAPQEPRTRLSLDRLELARQWVWFALRQVMEASAEPFVRTRPSDATLLSRVRLSLDAQAGPLAGEQIEAAVDGIGRCLATDLWPWHVRRFHRRPVMWMFADDRRGMLVLHARATRAVMTPLLAELRARPPEGWDRFIDDGIAINLAPLRQWVRLRSLQAWLEKVDRDLACGRFPWSLTAACSVSRSRPRAATAARALPTHRAPASADAIPAAG